MSNSGGERMYRNCLVCGRPFRFWNWELRLRNRGKFCTRQCYRAAWRAFSMALADGRLEVILANELERIKAESGQAR
jgi:hypothetical protein